MPKNTMPQGHWTESHSQYFGLKGNLHLSIKTMEMEDLLHNNVVTWSKNIDRFFLSVKDKRED